MEAGPVDRGLRCQCLVQHAPRAPRRAPCEGACHPRRRPRARGRHRRRRASAPSCSPSGPPAGAARGSDRSHRACCSDAGRAPAASRLSRGRGSTSARTRSRRGRRREVRRVAVGRRLVLERLEQRIGAAGRIERASVSGMPDSPARVRTLRPANAHSTGSDQATAYDARSRGGDCALAVCHQLEQGRRDRARVDRRRALVANELQRRDEPRLPKQVALDEQRSVTARTARHPRASSSPARAWRGTTRAPSAASLPSRARSSAGATSSGQGSRPCARHNASSPAGRPGTAHDDAPIAYCTGSSPKRTGSDSIGAPSPEGTQTKQSRLRTVPVAASR